jgi:hypothetical protein
MQVHQEATVGDFAFTPDERVRSIAEAFTDGLVDLDEQPFDFTDDSVQAVERLAASLHRSRPHDWKTNPASSEDLEGSAKVLGFYVGEVMRLHHGAVWGFVEMPDGDRTYGVLLPDGSLTSPIAKALKRLTDGPGDDLWSYFRIVALGE